MPGDVDDRDLLFEALAIHLGLMPRHASESFRRVDGEDGPPLGRVLVEESVLTASQCALVETLVEGLIARHGDATRALDALSGFGRLRVELERRHAGEPGDLGHPTLPSVPARRDAPHSIDPPDDHDEPMGLPGPIGARFRVLRPHAQGGIGKISVAMDAELHREVALKQIKPERADDGESRARFLLEAEVTGRLEHPGVVPVYGLGSDADGRPYYAMRLVRGISLDEAIRQFHRGDEDPRRDPRERSMALRQLLDRFVDVCQTVAYAHSRNVLHRDLKPANILLGPFNESLVVDWGLAKVLGREPEARPPSSRGEARPSPPIPEDGSSEAPLGASSSTDTVAGMAFGTPAYMSPEQAEGRLEQLGPPSDVYSLGAVLYTLLTGHPPFDYVWCDVTAMLERVRRSTFPTPRAVNPRVPRALEAVCLKAMANRVEDRYQSATELSEEIQRWLADEPVRADREPAWARLARWGRRHRPAVAGAAVLLVTAVAALSAGIVLIGREQRRTEANRRLAVDRAEALRRRDAISRVNLAYREYLDDNVALGDELLDACPRDLRDWEWSYARRLGHAELRSWPSGNGRDVWCVAFAPDGMRLAAGSGPWSDPREDPTGELAVRDVRTGAEAFAKRGLEGAVQAIAYSPDGRTLVMAHGWGNRSRGVEPSSTIVALEARGGRELWRAEERGAQVLSLAFSPDGRTIASGCGAGFNEYESSGYVRLRSSADGAEKGPRIGSGPGGVLAVAYSPDGRTLALTARDAVDLRDVADPSYPLVRRLSGHANFVYAVAFSPDGRRVATGGWDRTIRIWDPRTGEAIETLVGHRGFVRGLAFGPDGRRLVSCSEDKGVRRWDLDGGEVAAFHGHTGFVHCVAFGPDGALAASGDLDGTVKLWPAMASDTQVTFRNGSGWVGALAFSPDGRSIATSHQGCVRIWDPRTGEERGRIAAPNDLLGRFVVAYSPVGGVLAASGPDRSVVLWDAEGMTRLGALRAASDAADAAFSPDGALLATCAGDGRVRVWDVERRALVRETAGHARGDNAVAYSPDGRAIAAAGEDRIVRVWDAGTGAELARLEGHRNGIRDVAFSPDGRLLASVGGAYHGEAPAEIRVRDWATGRSVEGFGGHTGLVTAVGFFAGGRRLATASDDRTVKLWDAATGENVLTLRGHTSGVAGLAIDREGVQVASGSIDYSAKVWSVEAPEGPSALDRALRRAAVDRVQALFARLMLKEDVLAAIREDGGLSPRLKGAALEVAGRRSENALRLYESAWLTLARPVGTPEANRQARRRIEAACRLVADDPSRSSEYRRVLALALYREGRPERALEILTELGRDRTGGPTSPLELAVLAMSSRRLGRDAEARRALERLREVVARPGGGPGSASAWLEEAEAAMGARATPPSSVLRPSGRGVTS